MSDIATPAKGSGNARKETNYTKGIFQGVKYKDETEAVLAGAKSYAKMDWETIKVLNEQKGLTITPTDLIEAKKHIIETALAKRNEMPSEFN